MKTFIILLLLVLFQQGYSQPSELIKLINNKNLDFYLLRLSLQLYDSNRVEPSTTIVQTKYSENVKLKLSKVSYDNWIELLNNEKTDWAANLFLYEKYKTEASRFKVIKFAAWRTCCKQDEIAAWEKKLKEVFKE